MAKHLQAIDYSFQFSLAKSSPVPFLLKRDKIYDDRAGKQFAKGSFTPVTNSAVLRFFIMKDERLGPNQGGKQPIIDHDPYSTASHGSQPERSWFFDSGGA